MTSRTYSELVRLQTYRERFDYLVLNGAVGCATFGFNRWMNQQFYTSRAWRTARRDVIARDLGRDLAMHDHDIHGKIIVHHMNPLVEDDIVYGTDNALDPEGMISVKFDTHNAIHYGDASLLRQPYVPRKANDTKLW
jgi:hypothetical protein